MLTTLKLRLRNRLFNKVLSAFIDKGEDGLCALAQFSAINALTVAVGACIQSGLTDADIESYLRGAMNSIRNAQGKPPNELLKQAYSYTWPFP